MTADFFRNRLDQMIDLRHPLAVLSNRMPWQELEASFAHRFARQVSAGKRVEDVDLFGPAVSVVGAGAATAGRPRLPTRLMLALLYLKQAFNESDFLRPFQAGVLAALAVQASAVMFAVLWGLFGVRKLDPIALLISRCGWRLNFSGTTSDDWKGRGNRNLRFDIISPTRPASRQTYFYDAYKAAGGKLARAFKQC